MRKNHTVASFLTACLIMALATTMTISCGEKKDLRDLHEPLLWWERSTGLCSAFVVIDGNRDVWTDSGCEEPYDFKKSGATSRETQDSINAKFDALPMDTMASLSKCGGLLHTFGRRRESRPASWSLCGSSASANQLAGLQEPFLSLAVAFVELR
jgi:hypothetical protein